jgi:hypothetical protein
MNGKALRSKSLAQMVQEEQMKHVLESHRRRRIARDRLLAAALWYGISFILPESWKWFAWVASFIGVYLAMSNWEEARVERLLSTVGLSPDDFA